MINLPNWRLTSKYPAFYDSESGSSIEQTAKVYAAMQELIKEYNQFVEDTNKNINEFVGETNEDFEVFASALRQEFQDFIDIVDLKLKDIGGQMASLRIEYDELTESLNIVGGTE